MICISIKKGTEAALLKDFKQAQEAADLTEIWFEELKNLSENTLKTLFQIKKKPLIYKSFGNKSFLEKILAYPVDYIDLDINTPQSLIKELKLLYPKTKLIISYHNFESTPKDSELKKIASKILAKGADIIKIAGTANTMIDSIRMLNFLSNLSKKHKAICICMGSSGKITRAAGHLFGNYLMYAPLTTSASTASGQIAVDELRQIIKNKQL
ncbi:type I 3-dehydroquinate dehydratase [Candidatus Peregrinibacteria bacterium]|nr:type I 3-dehydroquinate dehydratase [Candidatus Peregrinibacteria bacterium]